MALDLEKANDKDSVEYLAERPLPQFATYLEASFFVSSNNCKKSKSTLK